MHCFYNCVTTENGLLGDSCRREPTNGNKSITSTENCFWAETAGSPQTRSEFSIMLNQMKNGFTIWAYQVKQYIRSEIIDLDPQEYCVLATLGIAVGFVLLSGRR